MSVRRQLTPEQRGRVLMALADHTAMLERMSRPNPYTDHEYWQVRHQQSAQLLGLLEMATEMEITLPAEFETLRSDRD